MRHRRGELPPEKAASLEALGFQFHVLDAAWDARFQELLAFGEEFGHLNVPAQWPSNPALGEWTRCQRSMRQQVGFQLGFRFLFSQPSPATGLVHHQGERARSIAARCPGPRHCSCPRGVPASSMKGLWLCAGRGRGLPVTRPRGQACYCRLLVGDPAPPEPVGKAF
mmetsp:Transcript_58037/g.184424  ORF Transcript_58037/g.184424 Transcript_58037/m.184424 type:complete len:167 (+) Transcript_58037:1482-1982(+)